MSEQDGGSSELDLIVRISELEVRVAQLANEVEDATVLATGEGVQAAASTPRYETLDSWVREYFAPTFGRPIGGDLRWCRRWQEHPEAITRLEALWRSWEALRLNPATGMATWLANFLDPQLAALLSRSGPFAQCGIDRHEPQASLP